MFFYDTESGERGFLRFQRPTLLKNLTSSRNRSYIFTDILKYLFATNF